jgi:hypothetical protein
MTILALIPIRTDLPAALAKHARDMAATLAGCEVKTRICPEQGDERPYSAHAAARNAMLDLYLKKAHTHVLWIDADVVEYPKDLAGLLLAHDADGIIAPMPLIEGTNRFYDVYGFIKPDGSRVQRPYPPYPNGPMASVGTCYLAPAALYHDGARYEPTEGHTEHYSVCKQAARVSVASDIIIRHADLPAWGLEWHTL